MLALLPVIVIFQPADSLVFAVCGGTGYCYPASVYPNEFSMECRTGEQLCAWLVDFDLDLSDCGGPQQEYACLASVHVVGQCIAACSVGVDMHCRYGYPLTDHTCVGVSLLPLQFEWSSSFKCSCGDQAGVTVRCNDTAVACPCKKVMIWFIWTCVNC